MCLLPGSETQRRKINLVAAREDDGLIFKAAGIIAMAILSSFVSTLITPGARMLQKPKFMELVKATQVDLEPLHNILSYI